MACSNNFLERKGSVHAISCLFPDDHIVPPQPFMPGIILPTHPERVRVRFVQFSDNFPTTRSSSSLTTNESDASTFNFPTFCRPRRQRTRSSKTTQDGQSEFSHRYSSHAGSFGEKLSNCFRPNHLSVQQLSSSWIFSFKFFSGSTSKTLLSPPNSVKNSHDFMRMPCRLARKEGVHNHKTARPVSFRQEAKCHEERRERSIRIIFWNMASTFGISPPKDKPPSARKRIAQAFQNLKEDCGLSYSESSRTRRITGKSTY